MTPQNYCLSRAILVAIAAACLIGCQGRRAAPPTPPPPEVTVTRPIMHPVQIYYQYNGYLEAVEQVQIVARVQGFLNEVAFKEGDEVEQDDLLFRIDPREFNANLKRAQADQRKANAELKRAQSEEARVRRLRTTGATSEEEFDQRVAARETAQAVVMQTEAAVEAAQLQVSYTEIHAPITGQISRTLVTRGNLVGPTENARLTTIVSMDPLYVYFDAPERDLVEYQRSVRENPQSEVLSGNIRVEIGVATEEGYPHVGNIDFRENRIDVGTGTVRCRGRIPNPKAPPGHARILYPGLYAKVRIPSGEPKMLAAIPEDALMTGQEGRFVYVVGENNVIEKRSVTVGPQIFKARAGQEDGVPWQLVPSDSKQSAPAAEPATTENQAASPSQPTVVYSIVAIEKGLTTDDRIVVNGLTKARPGAPVSPQDRTLTPPADNGSEAPAAPAPSASPMEPIPSASAAGENQE